MTNGWQRLRNGIYGMMIASVSYSRDGYLLEISEVPFWAYCCDWVTETAIHGSCKISRGWACPLCLCGKADWTFRLGWGPDEDGWLRHSFGNFLYGLGQKGGTMGYRHGRHVHRVQLPLEAIIADFPDSRIEWLEPGYVEADGGEPGSDAMTTRKKDLKQGKVAL